MAIPLFLPGESHGQRSLGGYSPQNGKELDTTEATQHTHTILILPNQYTLNIVVIPFQSFSVWIFNSYNHNQKLQFCFFTKYYVKESSEFLYNLFFKNLFIQLSQVFAEALGISVKSCGSFVAVHTLWLWCTGLWSARASSCGTWALQFWHAGLVAPQELQFPDQGSKLCPLHWKADS